MKAYTPPMFEDAFSAGRNDAERVFGLVKSADLSLGFGIPGTPVGASIGGVGKTERLPGTKRWVPRELIERVHAHLDAGLDPQAVSELEMQRGAVSTPALGGALGGMAAARHSMPWIDDLFRQPLKPGNAALGTLAGAGLGALAHKLTAQQRARDIETALQGVQLERETMPSAREAAPMLLSRGTGG